MGYPSRSNIIIRVLRKRAIGETDVKEEDTAGCEDGKGPKDQTMQQPVEAGKGQE